MLDRSEELREKLERTASRRTILSLVAALDDVLAEDGGENACLVCHI